MIANKIFYNQKDLERDCRDAFAILSAPQTVVKGLDWQFDKAMIVAQPDDQKVVYDATFCFVEYSPEHKVRTLELRISFDLHHQYLGLEVLDDGK